MAKKIKIEEYEKNHGISKKAKIADKIKLISLITNGVLLVGIIVLFIMYQRLSSNSIARSTYDSLLRSKNTTIDALQAELDYVLGENNMIYVREKLDFMNDNIVFKIKGFGNYYYSYDCMKKKVGDSYEYWAYNIDAAKGQGLKAGGC